MNAHTNLPVERADITRICRFRDMALAKRQEATDAMSAALKVAKEANDYAEQAAMGRGVGSHQTEGYDSASFKSLFAPSGWNPEDGMRIYRKQLDASIWRHLLNSTGISAMMDREAKDEFEKGLSSEVPEATEDNIRATMETLMRDADLIFQRGLANAFSGLDRRFKSHDAFKIGSRIIFERAFDDYGWPTHGNSTWDVIADVERVFSVLDGGRGNGAGYLRTIAQRDRRGMEPQQSVTESEYFTIKGYKNGNAHLWMRRDDLVAKANKILAEYYGEVIPDAYDEGDGSDLFRKSTVPAKDLQFYPSPPDVVERLLRNFSGRTKDRPQKVLEPSAGQGAIALAAAARGATVTAYEINPSHCDVLRGAARRAGVSDQITVRECNFLKTQPVAKYDFVLMNPPFYGTHYMDHVRHAYEFLAPGGMLKAILPASAEVGDSKRHLAFRKWIEPIKDYGWRGAFEDLPPESFKDSGTRIQTVILHVRRPR